MADKCKLLQIQLRKLRNIFNSSFTTAIFPDDQHFIKNNSSDPEQREKENSLLL